MVLNKTNPPTTCRLVILTLDQYRQETAFQIAIIVITTKIDTRGNRREEKVVQAQVVKQHQQKLRNGETLSG